MIIIGILLIAAAAAFGIDLVVNNHFPIHGVEVFGWSLGIHGSARLFILGVIIGAAVVLGVALILGGLGRKGARAVARHRERRDAASNESDLSSLRSENADLRQQLADRRDGGDRVVHEERVVRPVSPTADDGAVAARPTGATDTPTDIGTDEGATRAVSHQEPL